MVQSAMNRIDVKNKIGVPNNLQQIRLRFLQPEVVTEVADTNRGQTLSFNPRGVDGKHHHRGGVAIPGHRFRPGDVVGFKDVSDGKFLR